MRSFTVRSERIPSWASVFSLMGSSPIQKCLSFGRNQISLYCALGPAERAGNFFHRRPVLFCVFFFSSSFSFIRTKASAVQFCLVCSLSTMKLPGQFSPMRPRFSLRHLFLFSASALLVIVTYRPYSGSGSVDDAIDVDHFKQ